MHDSLHRWLVLVLHRRAGKTTATVNHHARAATDDLWEARRLCHLEPAFTDRHIRDLLRQRKYGHVLPTLTQARDVAWEMVKYYMDAYQGREFNESLMRVKFANGSTFQLYGADDPDRFRGPAFSGISFDEFPLMPPNIFSEVVSKGLADHLGWACFLGTIKGKNHLWKTYTAAVQTPAEWFAVWQDVEVSLRTETGATIMALRRSMLDDQKLIAQGLMSQEEYDQEWFLSIDAAIKGAYYGKILSRIAKMGQIGRVPYDPNLPVDTDWDLGMNDKMTVWFSQHARSAREMRLIDYYENSGEGLSHYAGVLRKRATECGYEYGVHHGPHDINVRELGTGITRLKRAAELGITFVVTPRVKDKQEHIDAVRALLPRCYFDEERCALGLEALRQYRKKWSDKLQTFSGSPLHDWASNAADSFGGLAQRQSLPKKDRERPRGRQVFQGTTAVAPGLGWLR
jgi:hypothetical protein